MTVMKKWDIKIREAQMKKIPYQIVVGDQEVEHQEVNVRKYGSEKQESVEKMNLFGMLLMKSV